MDSSDNLRGIFAGQVEKTEDPERLGRLKVRVPSVYGAVSGQGGYIGVDNLPWALPAGLPAGGSPLSGGMDWLPTVGDQVFVMFLDGEPEKPVWMWAMQTKPQAKKFTLHDYGSSAGSVGKPARGALTRYGHTVEWGPGTLIVTTSKGYRLSLSENDTLTGQCLVTTPKGNQFSLDDATDTATLHANLDLMLSAMAQLSVLAADISLTAHAGNAELTSLGVTSVTGGAQVALNAPEITLGTPEGALLSLGGGVGTWSIQNLLVEVLEQYALRAADISLTASSGEASVTGSVQATLSGPRVAIGTTENELLQILSLLIMSLGACTVVCSTPGSPSGPLIGSPAWAAVQAQLARLQSITGTITPTE